MLKNIFFFFFLCLMFVCSAQDYFQQEVDYKIQVRLDDVRNELFASETIKYTNHSNTELNYIYFHLWPNAYKNTGTAFANQVLENGSSLFYFSKDEDKGYIDQLDFKVDGHPVVFLSDSQAIDICKIILNEPLKPGASILITTPFHVKIPNGMFSRMGHEGQQYQITQWYPKPAVFDKEGWHPIPYLDQGEFYSEFGSFDVAITLPKNYVVGATGDLQEEEEKQWLNERAMRTGMIENFPETDAFPKSDSLTKTLHFKQNKIHDFAWFCDKRYNILKSEVELPHSHRKVMTWVLFTNSQAHLWRNATHYVNDAIDHYSRWLGDYPYDNCTAVDGALSAGGGMEYPNITVIGATADAFSLDDVITHEVGHNWFYGILGSNERRHAWMDEGINSFYEGRYINEKYPNERLLGNKFRKNWFDLNRYSHHYEYYLAYMLTAAKNDDQPCDAPAAEYTKYNYGADVYCKTGLVFSYLMDYLGEDIMDSAMQTYYETWKFKHPQPGDLRKIMEKVSGKNLSWFFDDLLETTKKLDYKILSSKKMEDGGFEILLKNTGQVTGPLIVCGLKADSSWSCQWYEGFEGEKAIRFAPGNYEKFKIDFFERMPEINRDNNTLRTHGLFKKLEPLRFQPIISLDNPDKTQIFYSPTLGWNSYNGFMLGAAFYNITLPEKRFEYVLDPMYAFGNQDLAGYGSVCLNFYPDRIFQKISIGVNAARFAYSTDPFPLDYTKIAPQIEFTFKNREARSSIKNSLKLRSVSVLMDTDQPELTSGTLNVSGFLHSSNNYTINQVLFTSENSRIINPCRFVLDIQESSTFVKASVEGKYTITYKGKNKGLDLRFFAGTFLYSSTADAGIFKFRTSGWNGSEDYLYDNVFLGRTEPSGVLSQQFVENDGAFKTPMVLGASSNWLTALNLKSSLPWSIPIRLYADFAITAADGRLPSPNPNILFYEAGVDLCIAKNIFEIYFPIPGLMSSDMVNNLNLNKVTYAEEIRFTLYLNLLNPFNFIKNYKF
jgi:hypothetical protein